MNWEVRWTRTLSLAVTAIAGVLVCAVPMRAGDPEFEVKSSRQMEHVFAGVTELRIDALWGSIDVQAHDRDTVEVRIFETLRAESDRWAARAREEVELEIRDRSGVVDLYVDGPFRDQNRPGHWSDKGVEMRYEVVYDFVVKVPRRIDLDLRTVLESGISVTGVEGEVALADVVGPIRLEDVSIRGTVETVSASIEAQLRGELSGPISFKTVSGNIDARFSESLSADLRIESEWGSAWSAFELTPLPVVPSVSQSNGKTVIRSAMPSARIGGGGPTLVFSSLSGDINLRKEESR